MEITLALARKQHRMNDSCTFKYLTLGALITCSLNLKAADQEELLKSAISELHSYYPQKKTSTELLHEDVCV